MLGPRSEHLVEQRLLRHMKGIPHLVQLKAGRDGWPDRLLCYRGIFIGIEIKSERIDHHETQRQSARIMQIQRAGGLAGVVRSNDDLDQLLHTVDNWLSDVGGPSWSH